MSQQVFVADTEGGANRFDGEWHLAERQDAAGTYYTACGDEISETFAQVLRGTDPREQFRDSSVQRTETVCSECELSVKN